MTTITTAAPIAADADILAQGDALLKQQEEQAAAAKAAEQAAKPVAKRQQRTPKAATAKPVNSGKVATKPEAKAKGRTVRKAVKKEVNFIIYDYARPKAGHLLAAFTAAWMDSFGMLQGNAVPRAKLVKVAGDTAVNYHTKNGNFERTEEGLKITAKGQAFFAARYADRPVDAQAMAAYQAIFATGQIDGELVKNQAAITKAA